MIPVIDPRGLLLRIVLAYAIVGVALADARAAPATEQKVALVIGNSAYPTARLRNPVNDAKAMADKLRKLGFDVILRTDVNLRDMTRAFSQFGQKLVPGSVGLFYYAGHGMQVQGKNFLIPVDAEIETEASVRTEAVDVDQLLYQLGNARLSMVILDACRNNPFERRFRGGGGGLAQIDAPTGTLLAYATAPGKVASDGAGANGLYTEALLKVLDMPGLKVEDIFKQVRIHVVKASDGQQTPWESSSLTGEFYFTPDNKAAQQAEQLKRAEDERAQLAAERAELQKALAEERKRRAQDEDAIRKELQSLRAELLKVRAEPAPPVAVAAAAPAPAKPAPTASPPPVAAKPAAAPPAQPAPPPPAAASKPAAAPPPDKPVQVAIAPASSAPPAAPPAKAAATAAPAPAEWAQRIALIEKSRGQLSFSKAFAILLDIQDEDELSLLLRYDAQSRRMPTYNAFAMGVNANGYLVWWRQWRERLPDFARQTAIESCARQNKAGDSCRLIMVDSEFREKDFLEVVTRLGKQGPSLVRQEFLKSVARSLEFNSGRL